MSKTPRTDKHEMECRDLNSGILDIVDAGFARQLERELATVTWALEAEQKGWPHEQPISDQPLDRQIVLLNRQLAASGSEIERLKAREASLLKALEIAAHFSGDAAAAERETSNYLRTELEALRNIIAAETNIGYGNAVTAEIERQQAKADKLRAELEAARRQSAPLVAALNEALYDPILFPDRLEALRQVLHTWKGQP